MKVPNFWAGGGAEKEDIEGFCLLGCDVVQC